MLYVHAVIEVGRLWDFGRRTVGGWGSGVLPELSRGVDVPQQAFTCFITRSAPSSPHLACGLNGSFFLRPCGPLSATEAGRLLGVLGMLKTCGTLHRGGYFFETSKGFAVEVEGGISKRVISVTTRREWARGRVIRGVRYYKKE